MSLVVGHNCPGCGLDTPEVACEACGGSVVWDRDSGTHCSACGQSASTITCPECGLRAELDRRHAEYHRRPTQAAEAYRDAHDDGPGESATPRAGIFSRVPVLGVVGLVGAIVVPGMLIAFLVGSGDEPRQAGVAPDAPRTTTQAAPQPDPPDAAPVSPPPPRPAIAPPPPPRSITKAARDTAKTKAPPRRESWLQRFLRSGSTTSDRPEGIYGDSSGSSGAGAGGGGGAGPGGGGGGAGK